MLPSVVFDDLCQLFDRLSHPSRKLFIKVLDLLRYIVTMSEVVRSKSVML
jgi:hypothetical protein